MAIVFIGGGRIQQLFLRALEQCADRRPDTEFRPGSTSVNMGGVLAFGGINPAGLDGMLFLAIDRSGGPTNNNIYMLASVVPPGRSTTDVMFVAQHRWRTNL